MPWNEQTPMAPMGVPSRVLLVSAWGAAQGSGVPHKQPAKHQDSPTCGTEKPWGWEWACPWASASLQGPGIPGREEERGDSCKGGGQEAPGRSPPSQDSSKLMSILGSQDESNEDEPQDGACWSLSKGLTPVTNGLSRTAGDTDTVLQGGAGPVMPRGPFSRESNPSPHTPARIPTFPWSVSSPSASVGPPGLLVRAGCCHCVVPVGTCQ